MSIGQGSAVADRFLAALSRRDFVALAATFTESGRLRGLVPSALREAEGPAAVAERFRFWTHGPEDFEVLETDAVDLADVVRLRWRFTRVDPELGRTIVEQTAYASVEGDRIAWMNLVCSGDRPVRE